MNEEKQLREELAEHIKTTGQIQELCKKEGRVRTEEEETRYTEAFDKAKEIGEKLKGIKEQHERDLELAKLSGMAVDGNGTPKYSEGDKKDFNKVNISRALKLLQDARQLDGVEAEVNQEGKASAGRAAVEVKGNSFTVPPELISMGKSRALNVATEGGDAVEDTITGLIPILAPNPIVTSMGATTFTGLEGNVKFTRHNGAATMAWEGESDANAATTPTLDSFTMSPKRVGGYADVSQQFIRQAKFIDGESWLRNELSRALAIEIDDKSINGSGSSNQPTGILSASGTTDIDHGTNGGAETYAFVLSYAQGIEDNNAPEDSLGWLTTPGVKYSLMDTPRQGSGVEGNFVVSPLNPNQLLGYRLASSTIVPSNLTKGSSSGVCHASIFGNWSELIVGQWGGVDLLVDPYTQATNAQVRIVINAYLDVAVKHGASFSKAEDILVS